MELGRGGFDRAKLDMLILIRIPSCSLRKSLGTRLYVYSKPHQWTLISEILS